MNPVAYGISNILRMILPAIAAIVIILGFTGGFDLLKVALIIGFVITADRKSVV